MVTRWGMSEKLGPVTLAPREDPFLAPQPFGGFGSSRPYSEATAEVVDAEVERILLECYAEGIRMLREHRVELDRLAKALLEHETLDEQEIIKVTGIRPAPRSQEAPLAAMPVAAFSDVRPDA
jgi:cell division protease FtsH